VVRKLDHKEAAKVMLKAGLKPLLPYANVRTKWKCRCLKCETIVYPTFNQIRSGSGGCGKCARNIPDLKNIMKIMKKAGFKPLEPYRSALTKWKCKCTKCKSTVYPKYNTIQQNKGGCKTCGNEKASITSRLPEQFAVDRMLKAKLKPIAPYKNNLTKWKSICLKCNRTVFPTLSAISDGHTGCGYCSGNLVDVKEALNLMRNSKLKPLEPYKSSKAKWKCKCQKCGKMVTPTYEVILQGQGGCRYCAVKGINMNVPSYLYLITHTELNSHKIGMGNHKKIKLDDRLGRFNKQGWQTYRVWQTNTGAEAIDIEAKIFIIIRQELKLPIHLSKEQMPKTRGETETINADSITLLELEKIIKKVIRERTR
jgi:hypothetical protein